MWRSHYALLSTSTLIYKTSGQGAQGRPQHLSSQAQGSQKRHIAFQLDYRELTRTGIKRRHYVKQLSKEAAD